MAFPINFDDPNATFLAKGRNPYPIHVRDTQVGQAQTIECLSFWQFSRVELEQIRETGIVFYRFVGGQPIMRAYDADPTEFEGQNAIYKYPDCFDLPVYQRDIVFDGRKTIDVTSAWKLSPEGLKNVFERGWIVFGIIGGQCDCDVFGINPIE